jgi:NAD-dependent dihydropyrimidine dehydrogenase PreA subunit
VQWILRLVVLTLVVISALCGIGRLAVYLDPYSAYSRMVTQLVHAGLNTGDLFTADRAETVSGLNWGLIAVAVVTAVITAGSAWVGGRLYCNTLCPVGTALGLLSRLSWLRVRIDADRCTRCGRCVRACKGACIDLSGDRPTVHTDACVDCFDCLGQCPNQALKFSAHGGMHHGASAHPDGLTPANAGENQDTTPEDPARRRFLTTTGALLAAIPVARAQHILYETTTGERWEKKIHTTMPDGSPAASRFWAIMPPSTVSRERFLSHCTACQACVAQCPEHILKPALKEYGAEGFMAPTVSYENGRCRPDCNRCAEACPTGAIRLLPLAQKRRDKMGWANFNSRNCVTQTDDVECGLCARRCPHRAITLIEKNGHKVPRVNVALCTGCGACEYYCPARPKAIYVEGLMY